MNANLTDQYCAKLEEVLSVNGAGLGKAVASLNAAASVLIAHCKALQAVIDDLANGDHDETQDFTKCRDADCGDECGNVNTPANNVHPMDAFPFVCQPGYAGDRNVEVSREIKRNEAERGPSGN